MPQPDSIAGDVISAATFLAGMILLYIGSLNAAYNSYNAQQQPAVKKKFRSRGWIAFWVFVIAVAPVPLALLSEWLDNPGLLIASAVALILAFVGGILTAFETVREIK